MGANLLAGYRRAANILKAEEKKTPAEAASIEQPFDAGLVTEAGRSRRWRRASPAPRRRPPPLSRGRISPRR